jgi:hypothetical protein
MTVVEFEGTAEEAKAAEDWCRLRIYEGYAMKGISSTSYRVAFRCPFEAQAFRDAHTPHTWPIE